jgi:uncharacterized lipoprotein YmbA
MVLIAAGCGSSPNPDFYVLHPVPPEQARPATATAPVQITAVHIPPSLDRQEMVQDTGSNKLAVSGTDRWGAPLGEMARKVLAQDLVARLPAGSVVLPNEPAPQDVRKIVVSIVEFGRASDGSIRLEGQWSLSAADSEQTLQSHAIQIRTTAGGGAQAQAKSMSDALGQLADQMAHDLSNS